jgi:hypothetical protein
MVRLFEPIIGAVLAAASVAQVPLLLKDRMLAWSAGCRGDVRIHGEKLRLHQHAHKTILGMIIEAPFPVGTDHIFLRLCKWDHPYLVRMERCEIKQDRFGNSLLGKRKTRQFGRAAALPHPMRHLDEGVEEVILAV